MSKFNPSNPSPQLESDGHGNYFINRDGQRIRVGILNGDVLSVKRNLSKHIFKKANCLGFNHNLISQVPFKKLLVVLADGRILSINRNDLDGFILTFQGERQLFVNLNKFTELNPSFDSPFHNSAA